MTDSNIRPNAIKKRIDFIAWLQFVGVVSVIFGHSMNDINVIPLFKEFKAWIYIFHLPLFFFVSAYLFSSKGGYSLGFGKIIKNRFTRLLVPYFIWNTLFIIPKVLMASFLNDQVLLTPEYFWKINISPRNNILGHTWFLFALFEMFLIAFVLDKFRMKKILWLPITSVLITINCFGVTDRFLAINDLMKNGIYFWCGLMLGSYSLDELMSWLRNYLLAIAVSLNTVILSIIWYFNKGMLINTLMLGLNILVLLCVIQQQFNIKNKFIEFISKNSFAIYILHWPIMGIIRFFVKNRMHLEPHMCMLFMLVGSIVIPSLIVILAKKTKLSFLDYIKHYMLGL